MKLIKKIGAVLCAVAIIAMCFAGCSNQNAEKYGTDVAVIGYTKEAAPFITDVKNGKAKGFEPELWNGIFDSVIGSGSFSQESLCAHTWKYSKPGCAFTSENLLAKAGGEIAANKIEEQLEGYYKKAGFSSSNTYFKFNTDGSFESKIDGKSWKGTYTFDEKTHAITMKGLLLSVSGYATQTTNGVSLLFESKKLLTLVQTLTALSGNSTLGIIGNITKNYDGVRVGFEMSK